MNLSFETAEVRMTWDCEIKGHTIDLHTFFTPQCRSASDGLYRTQYAYATVEIYRVNSLAFTSVAAVEISPLVAHTNP